MSAIRQAGPATMLEMTDQAFEATVSAAFGAFNARRFDTFAEYVTDDMVESYPQSGERLEGRAKQREMHEVFPWVRRRLSFGRFAATEPWPSSRSTNNTTMGASGRPPSCSSCEMG
jgi:hypothetical protein